LIPLLLPALALLPAVTSRYDVHAWVSRDVAPGKNIRLVINTTNLPAVSVTALPVDGEAWLSRHHYAGDYPTATGAPIKTWEVTVRQPGQGRGTGNAFYSRQVNLPITRPGAYLLVISGQGHTAKAVVNVTNLAVVAKRSASQALVWVTDHKSGRVIGDASLRFFSGQGAKQAQSVTGADGTKLIDLPEAAEIVVVRRGKDLAAVEVPAPNYDGHLNAFWQTDRPIYRPGQDILFKSVLRLTHGQGYDAVQNRPVNVRLLDPRENPVDQVELTSNANGSVAGKFNIPSEGMLGAYTIQLSVGGLTARRSVSVAEYRKPEFKVDMAPAAPRYLAGETLHFKLHASYYFGAALARAAVRWVARDTYLPYSFGAPEDRWFYSGDGNLYPSNTYASQPFAGEGSTATDNNGDVDISFTSDPKQPDSSYSLQVIVMDATNRQVEAATSVPVYASSIRLAVSPDIQAVAVGGLIPVHINAADLDQHPISPKVRLRVLHLVFDKEEGHEVERELTSTTVRLVKGSARAQLPALAEGDLIIEASAEDETGRTAVARSSVWAESPDFKLDKEKPQPQLTIRLDRHVYEPGNTVKAFISSNVAPHPVLIVQEGLKIWGYQVVASNRIQYRFATTKAMSPNAYLTAAEWVDHSQVTADVMVPLPDRDRQLNVSVKTDKTEYRPGDHAVYEVRTADRHGKPVAAEVGLAVVDEAIFALSPDITADPYEQYWGLRPNWVQSFASAPEEVSGGAYQRAAAPPGAVKVRERFEDTAYWNAFVQTGADGRGAVSFEVPDNLTTWRATARAFTRDTRVGLGGGTVMATRPLTLRLALPRQMAVGDHVQIQATVTNRTSRDAKVTLGISNQQATKTFDGIVPAKGEAVYPLEVTARAPGPDVFEGQASAAGAGPDMADALRMSVPVVPPGFRSIQVSGGVLRNSADIGLSLPPDIDQAGIKLTLKAYAGIAAEMRGKADQLLTEYRYGTPVAAGQLIAAFVLGPDKNREVIREDLAMLSRDESGFGWGWWQGLSGDIPITAQVDHALGIAAANGIAVPDNMLEFAKSSSLQLYRTTQLWEHRALLSAGLVELGLPLPQAEFEEVQEHGKDISPFARLRMIEALAMRNQPAARDERIHRILDLVSQGPSESYLPVGEGIGWTASSYETTAELLTVLALLDEESELQTKLVRWLVESDNQTQCESEQATVARALSLYLAKHPEAPEIGSINATVGGVKTDLENSRVDSSASAIVLSAPLKPGENVVHFDRSGSGDVLVSLRAETYRPAPSESHEGVRVARKFEVRNEAGIWTELDRPVVIGEPVRVTLSVWGDNISDAVKVDEPIPAGFEFVDSELPYGVREEVRDGKVEHYLANAGTPLALRYYLRSEHAGEMTASAPSAQYLRRPAVLGHGIDDRVKVVVADAHKP
jgi:uncharacterized protein YfaS (alpha-2-macroglobulin family)